MIKCKSCGSPLTIEHAFCPYCGKPNEFFIQHREDMAEYEQEFRQTQTEVYNKTNKFANMSVSIAICCVLVLFNIVAFVLTTKAWDVSYFFKSKNILSNATIHIEKLDKFEADQNYLGLREYYYDNDLYYSDELETYSVIIRFSEQYNLFYEQLMQHQIGMPGENSFNLSVDLMADSVCDMITMLNKENYYIEGAYSDVHVQSMQNIYDRTKDMLRAYANFTDEQLDELETYSKAKIMIMLEEGLSNEEN